jgi:alpha-amylase
MFKRVIAFLLLTLPISAMALPTWKNEVLYFVMLDRFADGEMTNNSDVDLENDLAFHGGDLKGLALKLDYLKTLGVTTVWLTPINQQIDFAITSDKGEFYAHHGYWANDFYKIDPRFGSEQDLKDLVDEAHKRDMKIILDVVYNHLGYGADFEDTKPEWLRMGSQCGGDDVTQCLSGLPDLRTELPEVRDYLFEAHLGLAERTGIDGFRLDTVKHVTHDFWQAHRKAVDERLGKDFMLLGEIWGADKITARPYFKNDELDGTFDFVFRDRVVEFLNGISNGKRFGRYLSKRHNVIEGHFLAPFLSNHDMPTLLATLRGDKDKYLLAATLLFSVEGMPVITWGEEFGREGKPWPGNRENMYWRNAEDKPNAKWEADEGIYAVFKTLINIRKEHPDLRGDQYKVLYFNDDALALQRGDGALVVVNRSDTPVRWNEKLGGLNEWQLIFSSTDNTQISLESLIGPVEARIFKKLR